LRKLNKVLMTQDNIGNFHMGPQVNNRDYKKIAESLLVGITENYSEGDKVRVNDPEDDRNDQVGKVVRTNGANKSYTIKFSDGYVDIYALSQLVKESTNDQLADKIYRKSRELVQALDELPQDASRSEVHKLVASRIERGLSTDSYDINKILEKK